MIIAGVYSFNRGREVVETRYATELHEVEQIIAVIESAQCKTKASREKTMPGRILYSPQALNKAFKREFETRGWKKYKVYCEYSADYYVSGYAPATSAKGAFRLGVTA